MSKAEEFTKAMKAAGKQKVDSVVKMVKDPVGTIKRVPQGASRFFGRIGEGMKGGVRRRRQGLPSISGVEKAKVALAAKLGSQSLLDQSGTPGAIHEYGEGPWRAAGRPSERGTMPIGGPVR